MVALLCQFPLLFLCFISITNAKKYNCECGEGQWVWFTDIPDSDAFGKFEADGFGRTEDGVWAHRILNWVMPGRTFDYDHIADWHDMCYDICGADPYICDIKFAELSEQYCKCVLAKSNFMCELLGKKLLSLLGDISTKGECNLPSVHAVLAGDDEKAKKKLSSHMTCQDRLCQCIPNGAPGIAKITAYLNKIKANLPTALQTKYPLPALNLADTTNPDKSEEAREWIFSIMKSVEARKILIQGDEANMFQIRDRSKPPNVLGPRKLKLHADVIKAPAKLEYCQSTSAMAEGYMKDQTITTANVYFNNLNILAMETLIIENVLIILLLSLFGFVCGFVFVAHFVNAKLLY